jgi:hypothetical protein
MGRRYRGTDWEGRFKRSGACGTWGCDWAPEISISSLSSVRCGAETTAWSGITGAMEEVPPAGAHRGARRRGIARGIKAGGRKFCRTQKSVHLLFFLVVGDYVSH